MLDRSRLHLDRIAEQPLRSTVAKGVAPGVALYNRADSPGVSVAFRMRVQHALFDSPYSQESINNGPWREIIQVYTTICLLFGACLFPLITISRLSRKPPSIVIAEQTRTLDLWPELGSQLIGDNKLAAMTRLPANGVFRVDLTDLTLAAAEAPIEWDGLTFLVLSDFHFHGTPSRAYFERIVEELLAGPQPDLVCLIGDYIDTDTHHEWIEPILGRLHAKEAKLSILGNHDLLYEPERVRQELARAGYTDLGNRWQEITIRGVQCLAIGHEGPWFTPGPDLSGAPTGLFRLCLSHTPDNYY